MFLFPQFLFTQMIKLIVFFFVHCTKDQSTEQNTCKIRKANIYSTTTWCIIYENSSNGSTPAEDCACACSLPCPSTSQYFYIPNEIAGILTTNMVAKMYDQQPEKLQRIKHVRELAIKKQATLCVAVLKHPPSPNQPRVVAMLQLKIKFRKN